MNKYKTANGTIATEQELREYYGVKFDEMLASGVFEKVEEGAPLKKKVGLAPQQGQQTNVNQQQNPYMVSPSEDTSSELPSSETDGTPITPSYVEPTSVQPEQGPLGVFNQKITGPNYGGKITPEEQARAVKIVQPNPNAKYETANGTISTEKELKGYYGVKFDKMLADGLFTKVEDEAKEEEEETPKKEKTTLESVGDWINNTAAALDRGFAQNLIGNPIKGLGIVMQRLNAKVTGTSGKEPITDALINFGNYYNKLIEELAPQDEEYKNSLSDQFAQSFGQVASLIVTGGVSKAAGAAGKTESALQMAELAAQTAPKTAGAAATALKTFGKEMSATTSVSAGLSMGQSEFYKAKAAGATDDQAFEAFLKNASVGSILETIPIMGFLKRFDKATSGGIKNYLKTKAIGGAIGGTEEFTTEVLQQLYSNKTAKDIYNVNQDLLEGVGESGSIGFGVGFLLNAMGANAKILRKQGKETEAAVIEKQIQEFEQKPKGPAPSYKLNGIVISADIAPTLLDKMTGPELIKANIEINNDRELELKVQDKIVSHSIKEQVRQGNPELNEASLDAITQLEKELQKVEGNKTQTGKDKAAAIREQIKNIQENQIQEEAKVATIEAEAPEITAKRTDRIAELETTLSPENETEVPATEKIKLETELETLKTEQDAIQKQITDEGLLRSKQPQVGLQEVGEGNVQPEVTATGTEEVTPEGGAQEMNNVLKNIGEVDVDNYKLDLGDGLSLEVPKINHGVKPASYFQIKKDGKLLGKINIANAKTFYERQGVSKGINENDIIVDDGVKKGIEIFSENNKRKGYGTKSYIGLLKILNSELSGDFKGGRVLSSPQYGQSIDSYKLWESLYRKGLAKIVGTTSEGVQNVKDLTSDSDKKYLKIKGDKRQIFIGEDLGMAYEGKPNGLIYNGNIYALDSKLIKESQPEVSSKTQPKTIQQELASMETMFGEQITPTVKPTTDQGVSVTNKSSVNDIKAKTTDKERVKVIEAAQRVLKTLKSVLPNFDIVLHNDEGSYNAAMIELRGGQGTGGNFSDNGDGTGRIDINLSKANSTTVAHEVAHAIMLKAFGDNPALFKGFRDKISKVLSESSNKELMDFANQYVDKKTGELLAVTYEEYLAELTGRLEQQQDKLSTTTLQRIAAAINEIVFKLTNGTFKPFENIKDTKQIVDFFNNISQSIRKGEEISPADLEAIQEGVSLPIGSPTTISKSQAGEKLSFTKEPLPLSFVTEADKIDINKLIDEIIKKKQKVWFWMADQLGRGNYYDAVIEGEHYLDAGPSFALDPKNRSKGVLWASGLPQKTLQSQIDKSDYIFFVSGSPEKAKLFNRRVLDLIAERINKTSNFNSFKEAMNKFDKETVELKTIKDALKDINSFEELANSPKRKPFLISISEIGKLKTTPAGSLKELLGSFNAFVDYNELRDGFYKENGFTQNDIMLVGKPTGLGGKAEHSTYESSILGEVVGVPDVKIDSWNIMPQELKDKYKSVIGGREEKTKPMQTKVIAAETGVVRELKGVKEEVKEMDKKFPVSKSQIDLYHGTPYEIKQFSTEKIGTGEGAQEFGWGLYFTTVKDIAKHYASAISAKQKSDKKFVYDVSIHEGKSPSEYTFLDWNQKVPEDVKNKIRKQAKKEGILEEYSNKLGLKTSGIGNIKNYVKRQFYINKVIKLRESGISVSDAIKQVASDNNTTEKNIKDIFDLYSFKNIKGDYLYSGLSSELGSDKKASEFLLRAGVDGVKYPSGTISNIGVKSSKGSNYVVFDENAVTIKSVSKSQQNAVNVVNKIIKDARAQGFSEEAIKTFLEGKGMEPKDVSEAMSAELTAAGKVSISEEMLPGYDRMMQEADSVMRKSQQRGASNAKVIENVMNYVKGSLVYEKATDVQREKLVRDVNKMFGLKEKSAPSAGRILGNIKDVTKITMTEKQGWIKQIKDLARGAKDAKMIIAAATQQLAKEIKELRGEGKLTANQAANIIRKFSKVNVLSQKSIDSFIEYMTKVFADADYSSKLDQANSLKKDISKLSKNKDKNANLRDLAQQFIKIDPSMVEDIDAYNKIADNIKEAIKGSTIRAAKVKFANTVNIENATDYITKTLTAQDEKIRKQKAEEIQDLMGIDVSELSYEQMMKLLDSKQPITKYNESIIRDTIQKMFDIYSSIIKETISTGKDQFNDEDVQFTNNQKSLIKRFMDMDISLLNPKEALKSVDALANFLENHSTAKMETVLSEYTANYNAKKLAEKGIVAQPLKKYWSERFGRFLGEQTTNLNVLFERMFKGFNRGGEVEDAMGVTKLKNNKSMAQREANNIVDKYVSQFYNKKANGEAYNSEYNSVERGLTAFMMRNVIGTEKQMQDEFNRRKGLIEESIKVLSNGNEQEQKKSELYKKVYNKILKESESIQEVKNKTDITNLEGVDFWNKEWSDKYEQLSDVSENVYNKILDKDLNYTPDKFVKLSSETGTVEISNDESAFHNNNGTIYKKETGVLMTAVKPEVLPTNSKNGETSMFIDLSFDKNNANAMYDALVDIGTAAPIRQIEAFLNSPDFKKIVPKAEDAKVLKERIQLYVGNIRNKNPYSNDELSAAVRSLNRIANIGVGQALGGVLQPIKQVVSVAMNTLINAGGLDMGAMFSSAKNGFINRTGYAISNRGIESQAQVDSLNKLIDEASKSKGQALVKNIEKLNKWWLEKFLVNPDVFIARASWMTYYEQSLKKQGIDTKGIDYNTVEINEDAADYAQRMVDRQQNVSDSDLAGKMFSNKESSNQLFVKMVMPFASFRMNQSARLGADLAVLSDKTSTQEDKKIAIRSLSGFAVEMVTFKMVAAGSAILLGSVAKMAMGDDEDDEKYKKRVNNVIKGQVTSTFTDVMSPLPILDKAYQAGGNFLTESMLGIPKESVFSIYDVPKQEYIQGLGLFGISADRATQLYEISKLSATGEYTDEFGKVKQISDNNKETLGFLIGPAILSNVGLAPVEVNSIIRNAIKYSKKGEGKSEEEVLQQKENAEEKETKISTKVDVLDKIKNKTRNKYEKEAIDQKIYELEADKEERKVIKEANAKEKQQKEELLTNPVTGEQYDNETKLKKYNPRLYNKNFGVRSQWYKDHKYEKLIEKKMNAEIMKIEDREHNYHKPASKKRNSDGSYKSSYYKRTRTTN